MAAERARNSRRSILPWQYSSYRSNTRWSISSWVTGLMRAFIRLSLLGKFFKGLACYKQVQVQFPSKIHPTATPATGAPPKGLLPFYWHFVRQTKGLYGAMFVSSLCLALLDMLLPVFLGQLVGLMEAPDRPAALAAKWPLLAGMVAVLLLVRPLILYVDMVLRHS